MNDEQWETMPSFQSRNRLAALAVSKVPAPPLSSKAFREAFFPLPIVALNCTMAIGLVCLDFRRFGIFWPQMS